MHKYAVYVDNLFIKTGIFFLTDVDYHPILESTRTKYFGSLTRRSEIESGEFSDELKIKGKLQVATRNRKVPERENSNKRWRCHKKGITNRKHNSQEGTERE